MKQMNPALCATALAFSPQLPLNMHSGAVLAAQQPSIPPGVHLVDEDHFELCFYAPEAKKVEAVTVFGKNELILGTDGVWRIILERKQGGFLPVRFLVDGVSVINPMAPIGFGASTPMNFAELPQDGVDFYDLKVVPHGSITQEFYASQVTGRYETCFVYTPPGYGTGTESYPVLYLQHGHGENERCWVAQGKVNFIMDNLLAEGKAVPCIIVMNNGMVQTSGENGPKMDAALLPRILIEDCIPFIQRTYRVKPEKEHRAMAGLSMGSMQTSMTVLSYPEYFAWAGVFSGFVGPLSIVQDSAYLRYLDDRERMRKDFRLFFRAMGNTDPFMNIFQNESRMLEEKGLAPSVFPPHVEQIYSGSHEWNVWRMCIRDFLGMIFRP